MQIVLFYGTSLFLLATAETFVIVTGGIDLSVGFIMGFSTIISAKLVAVLSLGGMAPAPAIILSILATMAIGLLPGFLSGMLVGRLRVPPLPRHFFSGRDHLRDLPPAQRRGRDQKRARPGKRDRQ